VPVRELELKAFPQSIRGAMQSRERFTRQIKRYQGVKPCSAITNIDCTEWVFPALTPLQARGRNEKPADDVCAPPANRSHIFGPGSDSSRLPAARSRA
jgi:hypothetical protein